MQQNKSAQSAEAVDLQQAFRFIELLTGSADTAVTWHPIDGDRARGKQHRELHGSLKELEGQLQRMNREGFGIFCMVNEGDGRGRKAANVISVRCVFVDCDKPESNPLELIAESNFDFDFLVESSAGKYHGYRRVSGFPLDASLFKGAQLSLCDAVEGDGVINDLPRIMRVPGFVHMKVKDGVTGSPFVTRIHSVNDAERVTPWPDLMAEYGWSDAGLRARAVKTKAATSGAVAAKTVTAKRDYSMPALLAEASGMVDGDGRNTWFMEVIGHFVGTGLGLDQTHANAEALRLAMIEQLPIETVRSIVDRLWVAESTKKGGFALTELGFAERFEHEFAGRFRFVSDVGRWLSWDGRTWAYDMGETQLQQAGQRLARGLLAEASKEPDEHKRKALIAHNLKLENGALRSVAKDAKSIGRLPVAACQLDSHPYLLAVDNGVIDLELGSFSYPSSELLITQRAHVSYQREAACPRWEKFIDEVTCGDFELASYLQKLLGYCLTGSTSEHALFIFTGGGSNGKSVLINTVEGILGGYTRRLPASSIMRRKEGGGASGDIAGLQGARFVATSEPERGQQLNESLVKDLASGDTLTARFNYGELFRFKPSHKILMATNHLPIIAGTDNGIWRRMRVVPFNATFQNSRKVGDAMAEAFRVEASGILNWLIAGCSAWQSEGLDPQPEAVRWCTGEYREDLNIIGKFLQEACVTPSSYMMARDGLRPLPFRVGSRLLYNTYRNYCSAYGYPVMSERGFKDDMKMQSDITSKRGGGGWFYSGLMVKQHWVQKSTLEAHIGRDLEAMGIVDYEAIDAALDIQG